MTESCSRRLRVLGATACLAAGLVLTGTVLRAQPPQTDAAAVIAAAAAQQIGAPTGPPATFTYANRPIVRFRASFLGRAPAERVVGAQLAMDRLVEAGVTGPIEVRPVGTLMAIAVGARDIFALVPEDADSLSGETLEELAALASARLQTALNEVAELRRPRQLLIGGLQALLGTAAFGLFLWGVLKARTGASKRLGDATARRLRESAVGDVEFVQSSRIVEFLHQIVTGATWALSLFVAYIWLTFVLRRFPYTRPWGESLREFILGQLSVAGVGVLNALPGLFTIALIVVITRFVSRVSYLFFQAIEDGRIAIPWIHAETAQPTRKLVSVAIWLFALAIAYPYLPGSESEAFQGVSVFVGLVISLGSTGLVNQVMSGFTLTYSRALRVGDFVTVADVEGTVAELGTLSTKIKTVRGEDVTIPNAVMVSQTVTNYTRFAESDGVFVPTSITIGYDVPWRQVQALMLLAAARSAGVRRRPAPFVRQTSLEDFYVKHTLLFSLEVPAERARTLAGVHANILDAFNEYGVQITSPNYEADPERPKIVPRNQWFAAPASPDSETTASADSVPGSPSRPRE